MLSKRTKYGLKALSVLARQPHLTPVHAQFIAETEQIPVKFLENILLTLRKAGYLGAQKGKGGGYYLLELPERIPLTGIIRVLEGPIALVPCVSLKYYEPCQDCADERTCSINRVMLRVRDSMLDVFQNHTVADLI